MTDVRGLFRAADLDNLPAIRAMPDERCEVLWVLLVGADRLARTQLSAAEVATVLRDVYGIAIPRQRVTGILGGEKKTIVVHRTKAGLRYQIMQAGRDLVLGAGPDVVFIQPETALSGIRTVESLLQALTGDLRVCDPYADGRTLDMLAEATRAASIHLLTMTINKPGPFKRDLTAFRGQHAVPIDVRVASANLLHDRYIIDATGMLLFGTSLNSIGRKQSFVVQLGDDLRSMALLAFDDVWNRSTPI